MERKNDDLTKIENDRTRIEDKTEIENKAQGHKDVGLKYFRGYKILKELPAHGAEADAYIIEKDNNKYFLKLYRSGIEPKEEVLKKIYELSRKLPECVVYIYEYGYDENTRRWYEIQEYAELGNLREYVEGNNLYGNETFVKEFVKNVSEDIYNLHQEKIIHRDIKPSNILVRNDKPPEFILTDFGISSLLSEDASKVFSTVKATYHYAAPETFSGYFGEEVDWWALGIITLELLTGKNPFSNLPKQVILHALTTKNIEIPSNIREDFQTLLKGLLTRDPKKRWRYAQIQLWLNGDKNIPVYYEGSITDKDKEKDEEWLKHFSANLASQWKKAVGRLEYAVNWSREGFTPQEAKPWVDAGIVDPVVARGWMDINFEPMEAGLLTNLGYGFRKIGDFIRKHNKRVNKKTLIRLLTNKVDLDKIEQLITRNVDLEAYIVWIERGFSEATYLGYKGIGFHDYEIIKLTEVFTPGSKEIDEWLKYFKNKAGFSLKTIVEWKNAGFGPQEARDWINAGCSPQEAKEWIDAGFSPQEAKEWKGAGFNPQEAKEWIDAGFSPQEAKEWKGAGFNPQEAEEPIDADFYTQEAEEPIDAGFSPQEAREWIDAGFNPQEAKAWKRAGFSSQEAREWINAGFNLQEATTLSSFGKTYQAARKGLIISLVAFSFISLISLFVSQYFQNDIIRLFAGFLLILSSLFGLYSVGTAFSMAKKLENWFARITVYLTLIILLLSMIIFFLYGVFLSIYMSIKLIIKIIISLFTKLINWIF